MQKKDLIAKITFLIDIRSIGSANELRDLHYSIINSNKNLNVNKFIYVACEKIDREVEVTQVEDNIMLVKYNDPGVVSVNNNNFKMENVLRIFGKLYAASRFLDTDLMIYLRKDMLNKPSTLKLMLSDLIKSNLIHNKGILLFQNKSTICNSMTDWYFAGYSSVFKSNMDNCRKLIKINRLEKSLSIFTSNEQLLYVSAGMKDYDYNLYGLILSDLALKREYILFHRARYLYFNNKLPLRIVLDDLFFFTPYPLCLLFLPFRYFASMAKIISKKPLKRLMALGFNSDYLI